MNMPRRVARAARRSVRVSVPVLAVVLALAPVPAPVLGAGPSTAAAAAAPPPAGDALAFLEGLTLIEVEGTDVASLHRARLVVQEHGGRVALMMPPSLLVGWVPPQEAMRLEADPLIRAVRLTEMTPDEMARLDPRSRRLARFFNRAVRGEIAERERRAMQAAASERPGTRELDAFDPPALVGADVEANLHRAGLDVPALVERGAWDPQRGVMANSDHMTGTVALSVFFVESDGTGSDPDQYTWTEADMQSYLDGVASALAWWSSRAGSYSGCSVTFLVYYYSANDPVTQQWIEPILHDSSWEQNWVNNVMANLGYVSGSMWSRVTSFNTWQRSVYQTDRAYAAFVPYNPVPAAPQFPDGKTAWAWFFGPHCIVPFRTGWTVMQTFAHESGHIFGACDEYAGGCSSSGCTSTCSHGTVNGNCETCNAGSRDCVMKANTFTLCNWTPGQVGWGTSGTPCTPPPPPPLPAPSVASVSPGFVLQGTAATLTITGSNFYAGAWVDAGPGIFVDRVSVSGGNTIVADVTVSNTASPGLNDIQVTNRDFQSSTLASALEIRPTTRHYVSPGGAAVFPYITPADAATSLADAMAAAGNGDTLFVSADSLVIGGTLAIESGVLLQGAWSPDFSTRNLATGRTRLVLSGNVDIYPGAVGGGLDGFVIENGTGVYDVTPYTGRFGGGVRILSPQATVANCVIRNCRVSTDMAQTGYGGGIFATGSSVDIRDNVIESNEASHGGGIYLHKCSGTVTGNTIRLDAPPATANSPSGGGVYLDSCSTVTLSGNTIESHSGWTSGGAVYAGGTTGLLIDGDAYTGNAVTLSGGALDLHGGDATVTRTTFRSNQGVLAGALAASATALTVTECTFDRNTASVGGGLYASGATLDVVHDVFRLNAASSGGGGVNVSGVTGGEIRGNTFDRNDGGIGGVLQIASSPALAVRDNVVAWSTGHGISCTGTPPGLSYNLVWMSSGNDWNGCTPGTGSGSWDPVFADTSAGDYHVGLHSGAIDAGDPAYPDADGSRGDLGRWGSGASPVDQPPPVTGLVATPSGSQVVLTWNRSPAADVVSYAVYADTTGGFKPGPSNFVTQTPDTTVALPVPADSTVYVVCALDTSGYAGGYSAEAVASPATAAGTLPHYVTRLHPNVPNPFNPTTVIRYELAQAGRVRLAVYDIAGRLVRVLASGRESAGVHAVTWDGRDTRGMRAASGVYFYRLETDGAVRTRKMVLLK